MSKISRWLVPWGLVWVLACCDGDAPARPRSGTAGSPGARAAAAVGPAPVGSLREPDATTPTPATPAGSVGSAASGHASAKAAPGDTKAAHGRIVACCGQLTLEAKKSSRKDKRWEIAASICRQIAERVQTGQSGESAAKTLIRAQIIGLKVPDAC